jgi:signal peptidase II
MKKIYLLSLLLILDIAIKHFVYTSIPMMSWSYPFYPYGGVPVFHDFLGINFSINHIANMGAAWGILSSYSTYLLYFRIIVVIILALYIILFLRDRNKVLPLSVIVVGAVGNILDYMFYGHVIDMFHFNFWGYSFPLFNLADAMICMGVFGMFFISLKKPMTKLVE